MPLRMRTDGGTVSFKNITRSDLPPGNVPKHGRELTLEQVDTAAFLVGNALGSSRIPTKADRELALAAQEALMGHIVFLENARAPQKQAPA